MRTEGPRNVVPQERTSSFSLLPSECQTPAALQPLKVQNTLRTRCLSYPLLVIESRRFGRLCSCGPTRNFLRYNIYSKHNIERAKLCTTSHSRSPRSWGCTTQRRALPKFEALSRFYFFIGPASSESAAPKVPFRRERGMDGDILSDCRAASHLLLLLLLLPVPLK